MKKIRKNLLLTALLGATLFSAGLFSACEDDVVVHTYETNGGVSIAAKELEIGAQYTLPTPTRAGYEFDGWFLNPEFSGNAVTQVTANAAQTYYAKWTQLFTVTLNLDGGSYNGETTLTLRKGANVYDAVKNIAPTKTGHQFDAWYNGNGELELNATITENLTLTANYKVQYLVEIWKQDFNGMFVKDTTDTVAYGYAGETPEAPQEPQGFKEVRHDNMVQEKELSSTYTENVFKHFYERREYTVTFNPSYPDGNNGTKFTVEGKYEMEFDIPSDYEYSGYCLMGWSLVPGGDIVLKANYIENSLFNKGNVAVATKAKIEKDATYYGVWEKGRTDMFGSNDVVYLEDGENATQVAYLSRGGYFFKGTYTASTNTLFFSELNEPILGRLYGNDQFILYSATRATYHTLYVAGAEEPLVGTTTVQFDNFNGITYREEGQDPSVGEYVLDGAYYLVTFKSGPKAGENMHIFVAKTEIDGIATDIFQVRRETEFAMGEIPAAKVNGGAFEIDSTDTIALDGYNMAIRKQESKESTYGYSYDAVTKTLSCTSTANGQTTVYKLIDVKGTLAFVAYDETMNKEFTVVGTTEKIILNGAFGAVYSTDTNTAEGLYTLEKSVFGGTIVSMETANGKKYAFRLYEETAGNTVAEKKAGGYAEFYYCQTSTGYFYAPLIVLNENEEDTATLYGYNYNESKFVKVSQGVYDKNSQGVYTYTATEWNEKNVNVSLQFFDLYELKSCEFGVDKETIGVPVAYWYSWTAKDSNKTELAKTYTSALGGTLVLVNGFAFYDDVIGYFEGTYTEEEDGLIKMTTFSGALAYFELNETNFYRLESLPYTMTMVREDGRILATETIAVDGRGGATYTVYVFDDAGTQTSETPTKGVIQTLNDQTENGMPIYRFVANDNTVSFRFIMLYSASGQHFSRFNEQLNGTYNSTNSGRLELDGYSYMGYYTDTDGVRKEGRYSVVKENVVTMIIDGVQLYFDIKTGNTFTKRGVEYGEYAVVKNQQDQGYYVELNGYNTAIVYKLVEDERDVIDGNAIYEKTEDGFMVTYTNGAETVELIGAVVGETFFIKNVNAAQTYIDQNTWTVLQLDNFGGAVRYTADGMKETGTYVLITDTFMYFESENGNGSVYDYNKATGTMTVCVLSEVSYYTRDFEALYFSDDGFAIFNGATRYYYKENGLGGAVLYREATATDEASAINAYGFVEETFESFDEELTYPAQNGKNYLKCDGSQLNFFRKEATKDYYPVPIAENKRVPFEKLSFQPTGEAEFAVTGTVVVDGITTFCEVVREKVGENFEMFVLMQAGVGYYRFDIEAAYNSNQYGSKDNVYEVTGMRWVITSYAYAYLDTYYKHFLSDYQYGTDLLSGYKNNVGEFQLNQLYNTNGEKATEGNYLTGKFFEGTKMYDVNGNLISLEQATLTSSDDMKEHEAVFVGADEYTYHIYFKLKYHSAFGLWGYEIDAFTREEKLQTTDGYNITVERRMYSDTQTFIVGTQYKVTVEKDGVSKVISDLNETLAVGEFSNLRYYYIERIPNEDGKEKVTFYSANFIKEEVVDPNEKLPAPYKSAEYFEKEAKIYTSEDGVWKVTYVEGLGIPFVEGERFDFVPDPGQYDEEKQAFVCKGTFNTYYVKIVGEYVTVEVETQTN